MKKIYTLSGIQYDTEVFAASDNIEIITERLLKKTSPENYRIDVFDAKTGKHIEEMYGEDIAKEAYKNNVLELPKISFDELIEKNIEEESLDVEGIEFVIRESGWAKEGGCQIGIYERDGKIKEVKFFFSEKDYKRIFRNPEYIGDLIKHGDCDITVEDSGTLYGYGKISFIQKGVEK